MHGLKGLGHIIYGIRVLELFSKYYLFVRKALVRCTPGLVPLCVLLLGAGRQEKEGGG